jgi:hypothetical protein
MNYEGKAFKASITGVRELTIRQKNYHGEIRPSGPRIVVRPDNIDELLEILAILQSELKNESRQSRKTTRKFCCNASPDSEPRTGARRITKQRQA